jgi:hypothetical protein
VAYKVAAPLVQVKMQGGQSVHLEKDAAVPSDIDKASLDHCVGFGLIGPEGHEFVVDEKTRKGSWVKTKDAEVAADDDKPAKK